MTKKSFVSVSRVLPLLILLGLLLTGCGCKHEWQSATCDTPKTCSLCQLTEGEALGHAWADATCETAKTCSTCQKTEGEPAGHKWEDATCDTAKTCSVCQKTEGEPADHKWEDATTEAPKTCSVCQKTEGEKIVTDSRFTTAANKELFGTWKGVIKMPGSEFIDKAFTGTLELDYSIIFNNDGSYQEITKLANEEQFVQSVEQFYIDQLYKEFTGMGYTQAQADEAMKTTYGMDTKAYAKKLASAFNFENLFANDIKGVYYVAEGKLYSGNAWDKTLDSDTFTISNNTLSIETLTEEFPDLVLTKS